MIEEGRLYVSFGSPYNACIDTATGNVLWERTDLACNHYRAPGSSPCIVGDLLILHFDGSDQQYVVALDKRTGKTVWKTDRSMDFHDTDPKTGKPVAEGDFHKAFSTSLLMQVDGKPLLVSLGSMALYAYEPATGKEIWRVESRGSHSGSARPVTGFGLIFAPIAYTSDIWAIRPDGQGVVTTSHVAWKHPRGTPWRSSPLLVGDFLYVVGHRRLKRRAWRPSPARNDGENAWAATSPPRRSTPLADSISSTSAARRRSLKPLPSTRFWPPTNWMTVSWPRQPSLPTRCICAPRPRCTASKTACPRQRRDRSGTFEPGGDAPPGGWSTMTPDSPPRSRWRHGTCRRPRSVDRGRLPECRPAVNTASGCMSWSATRAGFCPRAVVLVRLEDRPCPTTTPEVQHPLFRHQQPSQRSKAFL